eukprot:gene14799-17497_t
MRWIDPKKTQWSCIEGHNTKDELATPGGDSGEFLLMLSLLKDKIDPSQVGGLLNGFLAVNKIPFYMHTGDQAEANLLASLQAKFGKTRFPDTFDIEHPTPSQQKDILEEIANPDNIGCGHLRLIVQKPDEYGVPLNISQSFIQAYFRGLWADVSRTHFEYRRHDLESSESTNIPEKNILLIKVSDKFVTNGDRFSAADLADLPNQAAHHLNLTISALSRGVPTCQVRFTKFSSSNMVKQNGQVLPPVDTDNVPN